MVVGYGYWGPNLVRNVVERPEFRLMGLCERDESRAEDFRRRHPGFWVEPDLDAALADPRVEAVAIATPPHTHYTSSAARSRPASTSWSRSRWPEPPTRRRP